jgi:nicotinate-nucleotide pyrophosphorylase (carboxylating)
MAMAGSSSDLKLPSDIAAAVTRALAEDVGSGDVTAALIDEKERAEARVLVRESAVLCGTAWFDEVYRQIASRVAVRWQHHDGERIERDTIVCVVAGPARALLTGERTALNFLQTLSGTASAASRFVDAIRGTGARILDTRKTLPGLRTAQKYAVLCGGGHNHRQGLYDAILIKENHIAAARSIESAVKRAREQAASLLLEIEVENLEQLRAVLATSVDRVMLDNFSLAQLREAVAVRNAHKGKRKELEASGNIDLENVRAVAETGVDWISTGAITKNVRAIDYSMRFV